ncbi:MAG: DUF6152 family protein [Gammaproteobacteria bacterium]|jgi:hypothetical protein
MRRRFFFPTLAIGLLPLASVVAHHSPAMLYDLSGEITVEGTVTEYVLGNPHMRIYLDVDNDGTTERWLAEGGSRTQLLRVGWTGDELKPGDKVTVRGHPSRDGSNLVHMEYLTLPDGTERFTEDLRVEQFEDRRRR